MSDAANEVDVLPLQVEHLASAHGCLDRQNDKGFHQGCATLITCHKQPGFLTGFQAPSASPRNLWTSHQLHRVARQPETPLAGRDLNRVGHSVELTDDCGWGDTL